MRTSGSAYKILEKNMIAGKAIEAPAAPTPLSKVTPEAPETAGQTSGQVVDLTNENHDFDQFRHQFRNSNRGSRGRAFAARRQTTLHLRRATKDQETQTDPVPHVTVEREPESPYSRLKNYIFS